MKKIFHNKKKKSNSDISHQKITIDTAGKKVTLPDGSVMRAKDRLDLEMLKYRLDFEMGDSFAALEAFVKAFQEKAYPPLWTIDWIGNAFMKFKNNRYLRISRSNNKPKKKTLDEFLGLESKKRLTQAEKDLIDDKNTKLFMMVSSLIALGQAPKEACLKVSKMLNPQGLHHTWKTIRKIYLKYQNIYPDYLATCKKDSSTWTETQKKEFLSQYSSSLPTQLG